MQIEVLKRFANKRGIEKVQMGRKKLPSGIMLLL